MLQPCLWLLVRLLLQGLFSIRPGSFSIMVTRLKHRALILIWSTNQVKEKAHLPISKKAVDPFQTIVP